MYSHCVPIYAIATIAATKNIKPTTIIPATILVKV